MPSTDRNTAATLLHQDGPAPQEAVPLVRFVDRYAVADLVTVMAGESPRYVDDTPAGALALFEGVVDVLLAGADLMTTLVVVDADLRPAGLWTVRRPGRRIGVRTDQAVRLVVDAFTPYVRGGERALRTLADARAEVLAARPLVHAAAG